MRIALIGYGKMGRTIEELAPAHGVEIGLIIDPDHGISLADADLTAVDAAIEFTSPEAAMGNITACLDAGLPVVSGTTGWQADLDSIKERCVNERKSMVYATNFSIGVNLLFAMNEFLAEKMNGLEYDPSMIEIHHTEKKDAPSGTAITLGEQIVNKLEKKTGWVNELTDDPSKLTILSLREPDVPGTHTIKWESDVDTIEIGHTARSRAGFAAGSLVAAKWLIGKTGFYSMRDVLGL
jgi:4-hydroxy-tetrahydrodipicolinate reductase